ncbi:palmitoyltransferase ZDHHC16A isoform X2 [Procambarus clarkii]|uniref:palmitoyltransferase ZDHHC16A isoform X2 n=1 Tax=Procambarus clarkii TaxID=6728 RepID=UPI0037435C77
MSKSRTIVPQNSTDRMLFTFMVIGIPFAVVWLGCVVLPHYHDSINATVVLHILSALFILYNIFHNILLVIRTDASGRTSYLPSVLKPGWRYCAICQVNYPPRSYHCHICDECILKRDHHCKFTGCCIGYHNHRYFLIGILSKHCPIEQVVQREPRTAPTHHHLASVYNLLCISCGSDEYQNDAWSWRGPAGITCSHSHECWLVLSPSM